MVDLAHPALAGRDGNDALDAGDLLRPCGSPRRPILSSGGAVALCAVITAETDLTPSSALTADSASARAASMVSARAGSISRTKRTGPPATVSARISPAATRSWPLTGSATPFSAASTSSRAVIRPSVDPALDGVREVELVDRQQHPCREGLFRRSGRAGLAHRVLDRPLRGHAHLLEELAHGHC